MGAWGEGIWDNDTAHDLLAALIHEPAPSRIRLRVDAALTQALGDDGVDTHEADLVHATVALLLGHRDRALLPETDDPDQQALLDGLLALPVMELSQVRRETAAIALARTLDPERSAWVGAWHEAGTLEEASAPVRWMQVLLAMEPDPS